MTARKNFGFSIFTACSTKLRKQYHSVAFKANAVQNEEGENK